MKKTVLIIAARLPKLNRNHNFTGLNTPDSRYQPSSQLICGQAARHSGSHHERTCGYSVRAASVRR